MLTLPILASAKPTTQEISFRIETWPDLSADWSKYKLILAGESGNFKLNRVNAIGIPPLLDEIPDGPVPLFGTGGVRLTIGDDDPLEGIVEILVIHVNNYPDLSYTSIEKWTFTFGDNTLELSATVKDGVGTCIGTRGSGIFEKAKLTASFTDALIWNYGQAAFNIKEGTGQIKFN